MKDEGACELIQCEHVNRLIDAVRELLKTPMPVDTKDENYNRLIDRRLAVRDAMRPLATLEDES